MDKLISIIIDNEALDLGSDFNIRFTLRMPLPYESSIPVASSYWCTVPSTNINNKLLKHVNNKLVVNKVKSYLGIIRIAGKNYKSTILVKNAGIQYKLFVIFLDLMQTLSSKQVNESVNDTVILGTDTASIIASAKLIGSTVSPGQKYAFPQIKNETFFAETNEDYTANGNTINSFNNSSNSYNYNYISADVVYNRYVLIPMPYLNFILKNIFENVGWAVTGELFDDADFKKIIYYNNFSLENKANSNYFNAIVRNSFLIAPNIDTRIYFTEKVSDELSLYNLPLQQYTCPATQTFTGSFKATFTGNSIPMGDSISVIIKNGLTPITVATIYPDSRQYGASGFPISASFSVALTSGTVYTFYVRSNNNNYNNLSNVNFDISPLSTGLDRFNYKIDLKNHSPRITVSEFISQLQKKFFLAIFFDFDNMRVEFSKWNSIMDNNSYIDISDCVIKDSEDITIEEKYFSFITEWANDDLIDGNFKNISQFASPIEVATFANLPSANIINQLALVKSMNKFYVTVLNVSANLLEWKSNFDNFYDIKSSEKDATEIKTSIGTLFTMLDSNLCPEIKQQGSNAEMGINDQGLKFINYHGFISNFPFASNTNYLPDGTKTTGVPMQAHGSDGTFDRYGKKLFNYLAGSNPLELDLDIDIAKFFQIMGLFSVKSPIRKVRVGARNYLPESFDITIGLERIEACKAKLL